MKLDKGYYVDNTDIKYAHTQMLKWKLWSDLKHGRALPNTIVKTSFCKTCKQDFSYIHKPKAPQRSYCSEHCTRQGIKNRVAARKNAKREASGGNRTTEAIV